MKTFVLVLVLVCGCFTIGCGDDSVEIDGCGEDETFQDGGCQPETDAGYDTCYWKDGALGMPGCGEAGDGCVPLKYWEVCLGQCGEASDGCGEVYTCSCGN